MRFRSRPTATVISTASRTRRTTTTTTTTALTNTKRSSLLLPTASLLHYLLDKLHATYHYSTHTLHVIHTPSAYSLTSTARPLTSTLLPSPSIWLSLILPSSVLIQLPPPIPAHFMVAPSQTSFLITVCHLYLDIKRYSYLVVFAFRFLAGFPSSPIALV